MSDLKFGNIEGEKTIQSTAKEENKLMKFDRTTKYEKGVK